MSSAQCSRTGSFTYRAFCKPTFFIKTEDSPDQMLSPAFIIPLSCPYNMDAMPVFILMNFQFLPYFFFKRLVPRKVFFEIRFYEQILFNTLPAGYPDYLFPYRPQHFLYFFPLPQGHGSFGYIFFGFTTDCCRPFSPSTFPNVLRESLKS